MDQFATSMSDVMNNVTQVLQATLKQSKKPEEAESHSGDDKKTLTVIAMLQEQRTIALKDEDVSRKAKSVKTVDTAPDRAFGKLA